MKTLSVETRFGHSRLLIAGVVAVLTIGVAILILRPAASVQIQRETVLDTVSVGTVSFVAVPGEELIESEIVENRIARVTNSSATSDDITETITRKAVSGWLPTEFQNVEIKFRIDRDTRMYEHDLVRFMVADEIRHGYHSFPANVDPEKTYPIWIEEFFQPLDATYVRTTEIDNVSVLVFAIEVTNTAVWADTHASTARRNGDAHMTYFVEPYTGIIVDHSSAIVTRSLDQALGWSLTFEQHMKFSPETVEANLSRVQAAPDKQVLSILRIKP